MVTGSVVTGSGTAGGASGTVVGGSVVGTVVGSGAVVVVASLIVVRTAGAGVPGPLHAARNRRAGAAKVRG